jgi:acetolactate synthase regulatory subunit
MRSATVGMKLEARVMRMTKHHGFCLSQIITEIKEVNGPTGWSKYVGWI